MNLEEREAIEDLCSEFLDVFFLEGDKVSCADAAEYERPPVLLNQSINDHTGSHILRKWR